MKKFVLGLISLSFFCFTGCADFWDALFESGGSSTPSYGIVTATESESYKYDASFPIYEVTPKTKSVTISNVPSDKSLYIAKVNTGDSTVALTDTRVVQNSSTGYRAAAETEFKSLGNAAIPESKYKHFHAPEISLADIQTAAKSARALTGTSTLAKKTRIKRTVGTKKSIYVDSNPNMDSYTAKYATLRAVGTYCNVWVVDDYFTTETATGAKVDSSIAENFAKKFDSFYPVVHTIFGKECDNIIYSYSSAESLKAASADYPMTSYSDTGIYVNIVLYDIGADSSLPQSQQCGVLGYFFAKDYYSKIEPSLLSSSVVQYSNQGKYFYVDSYYAREETATTISTLAHEFQHMINYGVKNVEKGIESSGSSDYNISNKIDTAYNEMLSMLCEDMMSDFLGLDDTTNVKSERLPTFNTTYFYSGIREYLSTNSALSYSTAYGFGSWLCRQYGGAALVQEIMSNDYGGNNSLVKAVNSLNKTGLTFDEIFQQFLLALTNGGATTGYTHNKAAAETVDYKSDSVSSYKYPMTAINLWGEAYSYPTDKNPFLVKNQQDATYDSSETRYNGPFLFSNKYGFPLRPGYGITLHKLGTTDSTSSLSLTFSDTGADCVTMYVIIQ